jgi:hypothetical protein
MKNITKKYIVDENQKTIAVQIDINDFEKIERAFEDYGLGQLMDENAADEPLSLEDAKAYYAKLKKG